MSSENINLTFVRHRDVNNEPTCSACWGDASKMCMFLGTQLLREVCLFPTNGKCDTRLDRRGADGLGTLIPHGGCPFWGGDTPVAQHVTYCTCQDPRVITEVILVRGNRIAIDKGVPVILCGYMAPNGSSRVAYRGLSWAEFRHLESELAHGASSMEDYLNMLDIGDFKVENLGVPGQFAITRVLE